MQQSPRSAKLVVVVAGLSICLSVVSSSRAAAQDPFQGARALAVIAGETITVAEFEREMARRGVQRGQFESPESRRELLDELVREKALEMAARRDGYAEHPEVQEVQRRVMVSKYIDDRLDSLLTEAAVSEEDIERHYREHSDEYRLAGRLRGAIILIAVPPKAAADKLAELEKKARSVRDQANGADDRAFALLARRHSDDGATRYLAGNIGWITDRGRPLKWPPEVVEALFALRNPGEIGPLVRGDKGFYVVRLVEREDARLRPLEQLRAGIAHRLLKERRDQLRADFYAGLFGQLEVAQYNEVLESVEAPVGAPGLLAPPPVPDVRNQERAVPDAVDVPEEPSGLAAEQQQNGAFQK